MTILEPKTDFEKIEIFWIFFEIFEKIQKFEIFKRFYSQNGWSYEKNFQDEKVSKLSEFSNEITLMQKKSFLAILEQKTYFEKNSNFLDFLI